MITKTRQVASEIINNGRGHFAYNDRLVDGRRSLKVWGWNVSDYMKAQRKLERMGCKVQLVSTTMGYLRLHVQE